MGAAGRNFHNFNVFFRNNIEFDVACFTAEQIPDIDGRNYPYELAGALYKQGIPIYPETDLSRHIKELDAELVAFSYSDVPYDYIMSRVAIVQSAGADFMLLGTKHTEILQKYLTYS